MLPLSFQFPAMITSHSLISNTIIFIVRHFFVWVIFSVVRVCLMLIFVFTLAQSFTNDSVGCDQEEFERHGDLFFSLSPRHCASSASPSSSSNSNAFKHSRSFFWCHYSHFFVPGSLAQVFQDYFNELEEESIRDNFVIIYELLDEVMDFGYPQHTEAKVLKEYVQIVFCPFGLWKSKFCCVLMNVLEQHSI